MKNQYSLEWLISFSKFIYTFRDIERTMYTKINDRMENDSEHSYQFAMICWYIISTKWLILSLDKVIKYALVHDLVEIYAWDTDTFWSVELKNSKEEREKNAFEKIKKEFTKFHEMINCISEYEQKDNEEAKFVYAIDKIIAPINIYNSNWFQRKDKKITFEWLLDNKSKKIEISNDANEIWIELCLLLEKNKKELFVEC